MSQIVIRRVERRWQDRTRDYKIIVDGRKVARVGNGGKATISIEPGKHNVRMAIDWGRSKPLDVHISPEQSLQLECGPNVKPGLALIYAIVLFRRWIWLRPANDAIS